MNHWCESCARKNLCYMVDDRPKCFVPITNTASGTPYLVGISSISRDSHEIAKTEPQTEVIMPKKCKGCDSASKIIEAYSRGFKDGAEAVKVMPSTECGLCKHFKDRPNYGWECEYDTFEECNYEPKDEPQTERSACDTCQWYNSGIPCGVEPSVCKRAVEDEPQMERIKTPDYCDICNHKGCRNCIANNLDDYCVPSGYEPITQTETQNSNENSNLTFEKPQK